MLKSIKTPRPKLVIVNARSDVHETRNPAKRRSRTEARADLIEDARARLEAISAEVGQLHAKAHAEGNGAGAMMAGQCQHGLGECMEIATKIPIQAANRSDMLTVSALLVLVGMMFRRAAKATSLNAFLALYGTAYRGLGRFEQQLNAGMLEREEQSKGGRSGKSKHLDAVRAAIAANPAAKTSELAALHGTDERTVRRLKSEHRLSEGGRK